MQAFLCPLFLPLGWSLPSSLAPLLSPLSLCFAPTPFIIRSSRGLEMPLAEGVYTLL